MSANKPKPVPKNNTINIKQTSQMLEKLIINNSQIKEDLVTKMILMLKCKNL